MKAVRVHEWGGPTVLGVEEVAEPHAGPGQVRVRVRAVSLNLADLAAVSSERMAGIFGLSLPAGVGNDFAGVVDEVGDGVNTLVVGDRVFGGTRSRAAAEFIVVTPSADGAPRGLHNDELYPTPDGVDDVTASTIQTAGLTADAAVTAVGLSAADTVLIGGAAGGVGVYAVLLAKLAGARVIGTASESTADFLRTLGAEPVSYGDGLADRVRSLAPEGITAVIDLHGTEAAQTGLDLNVPGNRIATVAAHDPEFTKHVRATGSLQAPADSSVRLAGLLDQGRLRIPIEATYPLDAIAQSAGAVLGRHAHGKIVVTL